MLVKIYAMVFNRPDLLQQQIDCFNKYLQDEFEFNVVYDTRDDEYLEQFKEICEKNSVNFYHHQSQPGILVDCQQISEQLSGTA